MFFVPITKMDPSLTLEELKKSEGSQLPSEGKEFGSFLKEAIREADQALQETSEMDRKLALGEIDDLHSAMIQAEQSAAAVEFTTQLTSKAVSAYNQIMGMQV